MKLTNMQKKVVISSIAIALAITSTSLGAVRIHGEAGIGNKHKVVSIKKESNLKTTTETVKKALLTASGDVTGRDDAGNSDSANIAESDYGTITDLMIGDQVPTVPANKFTGLKNITTLSFKKPTESTNLVATIGANAFKGTGITSVTFPNKLTSIEAGAFADIPTLTTVNFTNSINLADIKEGAFENSGLTTLDLSAMNSGTTNTTLNVGANAFKGNTNLATVTLSSKMTEFKPEVFASTKLTTIEIKQGVTKVDKLAFKGTPLANLTVATGNANFVADANVLFTTGKTKLLLYPEGKTGAEFTIPDTVTHIEPNAFGSAPALTKVITGTALTHIGDYAFDGASQLGGVELKTALTNIGQYAFKGTALARIALPDKITQITTEMFAGATKLATLDLRKASGLITVQTDAFKDTALNAMIIGKTTGALSTITAGAFTSTATSKMISFLDDSNVAISGNDLKTLLEKYKNLIQPENGSWTFNVKLPTPNATVDYTNMKLTGLEPFSKYSVDGTEYTIDSTGTLALLKAWGGKAIKIVRTATLGQLASDAQDLTIKALYTVNVDGKEHSVKEKDATVTITTPVKEGYVFTQWQTTDVALPNATSNTITFTMPAKDVNLTAVYTKIILETPTKDLVFDGKNDVVISIKSKLDNFSKIAVDTKNLTVPNEYTVAGTDSTIITLKKAYLETLTTATQFTITFKEGGELTFHVGLYGEAPVAQANYKVMKLTGLVEDAQYKINGEVKTADAQGMIQIEKSWGDQTLEIIKVATGTETDSKPQTLKLQAFYTIRVDGNEVGFTIKDTAVTLKAESKDGYKFKIWNVTGITLADASKEDITFAMPANDVELTTTYTQIITSKPEEMVYNGTNEVTIRFDIPMVEFKDIEYNGEKLVKEVDYTVKSGSTIITFTKTFLDRMKEGMNGIKAVFTNNAVTFTIKHEGKVPPVQPIPPLVEPTNPVTPQGQPAKPVIGLATTKNPNTGDSTNMFLLFSMMLVSVGAFIFVKKERSNRKG